MQIAIVADDLTSASDCGIQFARVGFGSVVAFAASTVAPLGGWPVVSLDADSRCRSSAEAGARVAACVRALRDRDVLYKTVDSTLRGHLAVELRMAQIAGGRARTLLAPAFPAAGRTTRGGRQYLNDTPVSGTAFAGDPCHPVRNDDIRSILGQAGISGLRLLSRATLRDAASVNSALSEAPCVLADAETEGDLQALVEAITVPRDVLWVGSPGLARALAATLTPPTDYRLNSKPASRLLVAVGSLNPVSRRQLDTLYSAQNVAIVEIDAAVAVENPARAARLAVDAAAAASKDLRLAGTVAVTSSLAQAGGLPSSLSGAPVAAAITCAVTDLQKSQPFDGFVLTGGDTASCVAHRLGATGIELEGELTPGLASGVFTGAVSARVLTKAGGFGDDRALLQACDYMRARRGTT